MNPLTDSCPLIHDFEILNCCEARKILFDFLKKRQYNYRKRVASKRKSSLPAARFWFAENKYRREKCVACQRKSSL